MTDDDDDGAAIRCLKLNDIRDVIKEKTRRLSCQLPCPANRCACCRRIHFDPPGSKTGGPISGGPFFSRAPSEPEAHKHAFQKRGMPPSRSTAENVGHLHGRPSATAGRLDTASRQRSGNAAE